MFSKKLLLACIVAASTSSLFADDTQWRFGGGVFLNGYGKATGDLVVSELSTGQVYPTKGELDIEMKPGISLALDARYTPLNAWGMMFGLNYDFKRKIDKMEMRVAGQTFKFTGGTDKIQSTSIMANAVYRWNEFYLPFGLNYTSAKITPEEEGVDVSGGVGIQIGAGYWINENIVTEFFIKSSVIEFSSTDPSDDLKVEYDDAVVTNAMIGLKYFY